MKKSIALIIILLVSGLTYASEHPSEIIFKYYEALNIGNYKKAYSFLSHERKSLINENEYIIFHEKSPYKEVYEQFITYELLEKVVLKDSAVIKLKTTMPAQSVILPIFYSASHLAINTIEGKKELAEFVNKKLIKMEKNGSILYEYGDVVVTMVKENGEWKLAKNKAPE